MTPQAFIGLGFVLLGVAVKVAQAAGLLGAGEVGYVGEMTNLGFLLLGKELLNKSPAAQAKDAARKSIAPIACVFLLLLLPACAGMDKAVADAQAARDRAAVSAAAMRSDLSAARGVLDAFSTSVTVLCSFQRVEQCSAAEDTIRVLAAALKTASQAVDVAESAGIAMPVLAQQVATVAEQARALGATVQALGSEVARVVDQRPDSNASRLVPEQPAESPEGAAPAGAP
jgi:hypothetical protein